MYQNDPAFLCFHWLPVKKTIQMRLWKHIDRLQLDLQAKRWCWNSPKTDEETVLVGPANKTVQDVIFNKKTEEIDADLVGVIVVIRHLIISTQFEAQWSEVNKENTE